ncbi:protein PLASTID MOVEMENT IMPAIRED 2 [Lactuca sativa]|nr:protein PLASTID MOVEMENT IMPAIRED 2 [Lactuca sativa]
MMLQPSAEKENYRNKDNKEKSPMWKSETDSVESELSDAKRAVRDLTLKIEESNSRAKLQRKPKWRQQEEEEAETSLRSEDDRYEKVMKELEHVKRELEKLKLDMARVLKQKRHAEREAKESNSKRSNLSASIVLMKKEIQELGEEQALVELARIEAVREWEAIEAQRVEEANRYKTQVEENERTRELQITLSDINLLESELNMAKEMDKRTEAMSRNQEGSPLNTITEELEAAKRELASIKGEGFNFMASMDIIRKELKHVREETARLEKAEQKRELTVQNLNSKILRAKARLEALTASETKNNTVAANLSITLAQLRAETEKAKKEKDVVDEEIENMKGEIDKTEFEIDLEEEKLVAAMEELKAIKSSESETLGNLRKLINTTVEAREMASINSSIITITDFEYNYLTGKAGGAKDLADKKIAAAEAWVEALKANEREILMKFEIKQREIRDLSIEVEEEEEEEEDVAEEDRSSRHAKIGAKVMASSRKSMYRVGNMGTARRVRSQKFRSPASRYTPKSASSKGETVMPKLKKLFNNAAMGEGMI